MVMVFLKVNHKNEFSNIFPTIFMLILRDWVKFIINLWRTPFHKLDLVQLADGVRKLFREKSKLYLFHLEFIASCHHVLSSLNFKMMWNKYFEYLQFTGTNGITFQIDSWYSIKLKLFEYCSISNCRLYFLKTFLSTFEQLNKVILFSFYREISASNANKWNKLCLKRTQSRSLCKLLWLLFRLAYHISKQHSCLQRIPPESKKTLNYSKPFQVSCKYSNSPEESLDLVYFANWMKQS